MSLVQAIITKDFALIGADHRGIYPDGTIVETYNKVIKINNRIIIGITGTVGDNIKLFDGLCVSLKKDGLKKINDDIDFSYKDFISLLSIRFSKLKQENDNQIAYHEIGSIVCGFNGKEFEITTFNLGNKFGLPDGIVSTKCPQCFFYKGATAGKYEHHVLLQQLINEKYNRYGKVTLLQYKNIIQEVMDDGTRIDDSINNNVSFEQIKKKEVIK